jgi:hypothetical protein
MIFHLSQFSAHRLPAMTGRVACTRSCINRSDAVHSAATQTRSDAHTSHQAAATPHTHTHTPIVHGMRAVQQVRIHDTCILLVFHNPHIVRGRQPQQRDSQHTPAHTPACRRHERKIVAMQPTLYLQTRWERRGGRPSTRTVLHTIEQTSKRGRSP